MNKGSPRKREGPHPWGCSSVGRAPALQAGGQEFESLHLHLASLYVALRKTSFFSVACRHAMKSKLHKCLWKQASNTFLKFRFRNVPWKPHIEIIDLKYLRYKTSEAYRKIRKPKNIKNQDQGYHARYLRMEAVPAVEILLVKLKRAQGGCLGTKSRWKTW